MAEKKAKKTAVKKEDSFESLLNSLFCGFGFKTKIDELKKLSREDLIKRCLELEVELRDAKVKDEGCHQIANAIKTGIENTQRLNVQNGVYVSSDMCRSYISNSIDEHIKKHDKEKELMADAYDLSKDIEEFNKENIIREFIPGGLNVNPYKLEKEQMLEIRKTLIDARVKQHTYDKGWNDCIRHVKTYGKRKTKERDIYKKAVEN